jgi:predicted phage tail protein
LSKRKRVILHGYLKDLWSEPLELEVESAAEAIKAFCQQTGALNPKLGQPRHRIRVVGFDTAEEIFAPTDAEEIHLIPDFAGGKQAGLFQILIGVALVAASFIPGLNAALWAGASTMFLSFGVSMILGGLVQMLSPAPNRDTALGNDPEASKYLGAPKNTVAIGTRIPIGYGLHQIFGHYISFDIRATDVALNG